MLTSYSLLIFGYPNVCFLLFVFLSSVCIRHVSGFKMSKNGKQMSDDVKSHMTENGYRQSDMCKVLRRRGTTVSMFMERFMRLRIDRKQDTNRPSKCCDRSSLRKYVQSLSMTNTSLCLVLIFFRVLIFSWLNWYLRIPARATCAIIQTHCKFSRNVNIQTNDAKNAG